MIIEGLKENKSMINIEKFVATPENWHKCFNNSPIALHISAHGMTVKDEAFLVLENSEDMSSHKEFNKKKLKQQIKNHMDKAENKLEFVMISACHSEQIGEVFLNEGVPHVICVDKTMPVPDEIALEFNKIFYRKVFDLKHSVC